MSKLSLFILLISPAIILNAQTPITSSDVSNVLAPGKEWLEVSDSVGTTMNIGSASSLSQNWTAPSIDFADTITAINVSLSDSPYLSDFPEATHCQKFSDTTESVPVILYNYYKLDNDALYSLGSAYNERLVVRIGNKIVIIDTVIFSKHTTALFPLPVTFGATEQSEDTTDYGSGYISIKTLSQSVDAFGNFTFLFGTYSALRISEHTKTQNYVNGTFLNEDNQFSISWITTAGIFQVDVDTSAGTSGTVNITSASLTKFIDSPTSVNGGGTDMPSSFLLYQNYPNPFNPFTTIRYTIPTVSTGQKNQVTLKVYNVLGKAISTLVNENKPAGTYEVKFSAKRENGVDLPSGIYFYRLQAGSFVSTKKFVLLK